jgi:hypothetical protein
MLVPQKERTCRIYQARQPIGLQKYERRASQRAFIRVFLFS